MNEHSIKTIVTFLKQDEIKHLNMLYFMENNPVHSLERIDSSVILRGDSDHRWVYISSPNEEELKAVAQTLTPEDRFFAVIEDWMLPVLTHNKTLVWQLSTMKLVLPDHVTFPQTPHVRISSLSVSDAQYLYDHSLYQEFTSPDYIRERIQKGPSAGIHEGGQLVAWAMTQDDSAIGFLHVLDAYRRKGYGYELTVYLIHQLRQQGKVPFVHIEGANSKSIGLATKMGFQPDRRVHWFEVQP
jgi:8-oxo-dGTP diphosphatase